MTESRTVWVVQSDVPADTYRTLEIYANEGDAHREAARIVNRLIQTAGRRPSWHADNWQDGLQLLRLNHVRDGGDADDYAVWVEQKYIHGQLGAGAFFTVADEAILAG